MYSENKPTKKHTKNYYGNRMRAQMTAKDPERIEKKESSNAKSNNY